MAMFHDRFNCHYLLGSLTEFEFFSARGIHVRKTMLRLYQVLPECFSLTQAEYMWRKQFFSVNHFVWSIFFLACVFC